MSHVTLARIRRHLKRAGITHDVLAREAGVSRTMVVHLLAGRTKSANVVNTAKRLIAAANQRHDGPRKRDNARVALTAAP